MKIIRFSDETFTPASHENPASPGVLKKVLVKKADLQPGSLQMINWAVMPIGKQFAKHYHEDMQEAFVIMQGSAEITVDGETAVLNAGDTVLIAAREVHQMQNICNREVTYLALGVASGAGGRTVVVDE
jgi:mannose-6-phosphate isomerase-like protein (cupin superfamily)